jgi:hypothetical protein
MCIIIDANCFGRVFDRSNSNHDSFAPVLDWIIKGKGKIVYGGSTYFSELKTAAKYLKIFRLLREIDKAVIGDEVNIDQIEKDLISTVNDSNFDDPHIMAIVIDTKCMLICSDDKKSLKFMKDFNLFPDHIKPPKYYMGIKNISLLNDKYIPEFYKPLMKCNKEVREKINDTLGQI